MHIKENIITFIKKETILCAASILALSSMVLVPPSKEYISYIDFRVIGLLFCLMIVMAGLKSVGIFDKLMALLLKHIHTTKQLAFILIISCFVLSMWITNDVALITLVPFTIMICNKTNKNKLLIPVIVMQTVAANLGSMCTPIGNPQNLYLYTTSGMSITYFLKLMMPLTVISLVLILISILFFKKEPLANNSKDNLYSKSNIADVKENSHNNSSIADIKENLHGNSFTTDRTAKIKTVAYAILLVLCLLTVLRILDFKILLIVVTLSALIFEMRLFLQADYMLLLTFSAFFIFIGNMKQIDIINTFLCNIVSGNEVIVSVLSSQIISNVPAAILLSGFTKDFSSLIIGTNLGGLGTLIASMASLISFKYYNATNHSDSRHYLFVFSLVNVLFLAILYALCLII